MWISPPSLAVHTSVVVHAAPRKAFSEAGRNGERSEVCNCHAVVELPDSLWRTATRLLSSPC